MKAFLPRLKRVMRGVLYAKVIFIVLGVVLLGGAWLLLKSGPLRFEALSKNVSHHLAAAIGPQWSVTQKDTALEWLEGGLALRVSDMDIRNPDGVLVMRAPQAVVGVDLWSLLKASPLPRSLDLRDVQLRMALDSEGRLLWLSPTEQTGSILAAKGQENHETEVGNAPSLIAKTALSLLQDIAGSKNLISALDVARISNASLTLVDAHYNERVAFKRMDARFVQSTAGGRDFDMSFSGMQGRWELRGRAQQKDDGLQEAALNMSHMPLQDALLLAGFSHMPVTSDIKLSGEIILQANPQAPPKEQLTALHGSLSASQGHFEIGHHIWPRTVIETATTKLAWNEAKRLINIDNISVKSGGYSLFLQGHWHQQTSDSWLLSLKGDKGTFASPSPEDRPIELTLLEIEAHNKGTQFVLDKMAFYGPFLKAEIRGAYDAKGPDPVLTLNARTDHSDIRAVLGIWPHAVAPLARDYVLRNAKSGLVDQLILNAALSADDLERLRQEKAISEQALSIKAGLSHVVLNIAPGLPPLSDLGVAVDVNGVRAEVKSLKGRVALAGERSLNVAQASFIMNDIWAVNTISHINAALEGGADALAALINSPAIKSAVELDPNTIKGNASIKMHVPLDIHNVPLVADLPISVTGNLTNLSIEKALGKEKLEDGRLSISLERNNLVLSGDGKLNGSASAIEIRKMSGAAPEAIVTLTLDEAGRTRRGIHFGTRLSGPLQVRAVVPLSKSGKAVQRIEADFTRASLDQLLPGWAKPAGIAGKASFAVIEQDNATLLRDFTLDSGSVSLRGALSVDDKGSLQKADFSTFKLSQGDDMRAQYERAGALSKVTIRGNLADARPFINEMGKAAKKPNGRKATPEEDVDLDLAVNILTGFNDEILTNASIKAARRGADLRQLDLNGRFGEAKITAQITRDTGAPNLMIQSEDAGSLLRFLDLYRRMIGGELILQEERNAKRSKGVINIRDFVLRNEPALQRLTAQQPVDNSGRIDVSEVKFTKLRADFSKNASRLELDEAVIWGTQLGFNINGSVDFTRDNVDMTGTFIPAYGLNNAFSQVPLFGPILGGGQYEGLFAVNFRIAGKASNPSLSVNPLSAIAPGIFRKLFGVIGSPQGSAPSSAPLPPARTER
jgi:hypothetical protein